MGWLEREVLPLERLRMARDEPGAAGDGNLMHLLACKNMSVSATGRHQVVVEPVAHQRQRRHACADLLARVARGRQYRTE